MIDSILQIPFLSTVDPIWVSLGPLLTFNIVLLSTLAFFAITLLLAIAYSHTGNGNSSEKDKLMSTPLAPAAALA